MTTRTKVAKFKEYEGREGKGRERESTSNMVDFSRISSNQPRTSTISVVLRITSGVSGKKTRAKIPALSLFCASVDKVPASLISSSALRWLGGDLVGLDIDNHEAE